MGDHMATFNAGSKLTTAINEMLMADDIQPGSAPSYHLCKTLYAFHPIAKKMVDAPITKAQSQPRTITIPDSPEQAVREEFIKVWKAQGFDRIIRNTYRLSRVYGMSTVAAMIKGIDSKTTIDYPNLWKVADKLRFNMLDPLNTSGSAVLNQDPNDPNFQKIEHVSISGVTYNPSRCVVMMNEDPIYIEYTSSSFGYVGRSVFQRALLPLKSFIQSMITDDLVTIKAGVLIAKMKSQGSIMDNIMLMMQGVKRAFVKDARVGGVLSIDVDEAIESLDLVNVEGAMNAARKNILENIAVSNDMPAMLLNSETFAEGFADGTEDANTVIEYIDGVREELAPLYDYFTKFTMYLAWNPEFYKTIQATYEDWQEVEFTEAFYRWKNSFSATWPSLKREPESELIKKDAVRLESQIALVQVLLPVFDPVNKANLIVWVTDNFNELKLLFPNPLVVDDVALLAYLEEQHDQQKEQHDKAVEPEPAVKKTFGDSNVVRAAALLRAPGRQRINDGKRPN